MSLTASSTFNVADSATVSAEAQTIIQPPVGYGTGGRGRLVHPTLGTYDYANTPDETVNVDGDVCFSPLWAHAMTLGGGQDTLWPGNLRDARVIERWHQGDVGAPIAHLRTLWAFLTNPPDPASGAFVQWFPNYANARGYKVVLAEVRAGGEGYRIDRRLLSYGYAPAPVELELRIVGYV